MDREVSEPHVRDADYPSTGSLGLRPKSALSHEHAGTIPRVGTMLYDKTAKWERFSVENLAAGCIIFGHYPGLVTGEGFHDIRVRCGA